MNGCLYSRMVPEISQSLSPGIESGQVMREKEAKAGAGQVVNIRK